MEATVNMKPLAEINAEDLDTEGCIRLLCEVAKITSEEYRYSYAMYITSSVQGDLKKKGEARARMRTLERKLKAPLFHLSDDQIISLQMQADKNNRVATIKRDAQMMYLRGKSPQRISEAFGITPSIVKRWTSDHEITAGIKKEVQMRFLPAESAVNLSRFLDLPLRIVERWTTNSEMTGAREQCSQVQEAYSRIKKKMSKEKALEKLAQTYDIPLFIVRQWTSVVW